MPAIVDDLRFAIRQLTKDARLYPGLDIDAGAGYRSEYSGLQRDERGAAAFAAGGRSGRVVYLRTSNPPNGTGTIDSNETFSYAVYDALRRQNRGLSPVMAYVPLATRKVAVRYGAQPEQAEGDMVSGTFFSGLGVKLACGRGFSERDESNHAPDCRNQL